MGVIAPIFKVVTVASFMVHPRLGIAFFITFGGVGRAGTLKIFCACPEFCGGIFGQIVEEPLKSDAGAKTMRDDTVAVTCDDTEMADWMMGVAVFA